MADHQPHLHDMADPIDDHHVRGKFASRIGFMLAAVGSAIGLGNIWKFPYITGENGGAAFLLIYLACITLVGLPVLMVEFAIGRRGQTSAISCYRRIAPGTAWWLNGLLGVVTGFIILGFYCAVAGWVLRYFFIGVTEGFADFEEHAGERLMGVINDGTYSVFYQLVIVILTSVILYFGIEKGIERAAKYLMPLLFVLLLLLVINSLLLPGSGAGINFLFTPDFSKITAQSILEALGHAFFTLSLGMGAMITYASYVDKDVHLGTTAVWVAGLDTLIAITAGLVIFPAVFAYGLDPAGGPALIFITLTEIFAEMPFGRIVGCTFFLLVFIAALTSTISILEPVVTWLVDDVNWGRHVATGLAGTVVFLFGIPATLSADSGGALGELMIPFIGGELKFFDLLDTLSSQFFLPLGGLVACLFLLLGWNRREAIAEIAGANGDVKSKILVVWYWLAVTLAPIGIIVVLVNGIWNLLHKG